MPNHVTFVDTSVLCNLLCVPFMVQDLAAVRSELKERQQRGGLILPVTTVIETGNHVAQVKDGRQRRSCAQRYARVLEMSADGRAPWVINRVDWDEEHLRSMLAGAGTGQHLVDLMRTRLGCGDVSILAERARYLRRTSNVRADIWTLDEQLHAYQM